jgi:DtxR family Mn-dependent transcriptional regulator
MATSSVQNYLKTIYQLQSHHPTVTTSALAHALNISAASATGMVKKLAAMKLVRYSPYRGVELTPSGEMMALEVIRHHRLIELFLSTALHVPWDQVHAEAEKIEHVISEDLEERIAQFLGEPTEDPHGDPIPTKAGELHQPPSRSLPEVPIGQPVVIRRVSDQNPEHLRHFSNLGLVPKAMIKIVHREPFDGPLRVRIASGDEHTLDETLARQIWVAVPSHRTGKPLPKDNEQQNGSMAKGEVTR